MSPRILRRFVLVIFVGGIAGMIVGSVKDNNGFAITFGLVSAVAALGLIAVSSVAPPSAFVRARGAAKRDEGATDEQSALELETRVRDLVAAGADEHEVRVLVKRAIETGRRAGVDL